jgi:hypothetical protein
VNGGVFQPFYSETIALGVVVPGGGAIAMVLDHHGAFQRAVGKGVVAGPVGVAAGAPV